MSCDWNIVCLDCREKAGGNQYAEDVMHTFNDANHRFEDMWVLIRHQEAIAAIADLRGEVDITFTLGEHYGSIDSEWFKRHLGHRLWPIDEYGRLDNQCHERVQCSEHHWHECQLELGHKGMHSSKGRFQQ